MIFEVPLPTDERIYKRFAMASGWQPKIETQRSITEEGVETITEVDNPITAKQVCIKKVQELFANYYTQRTLDVNRKALLENAKKETENLGIVGYKEKVAEPK